MNIFKNNRQSFSVEIFPPKKDTQIDKVKETITKMSGVSPDYISVTYGAGGQQGHKTVELANFVQNETKIPAVAHLTCVGFTKEKVKEILLELKQKNIENVLALRGDMPQDGQVSKDFLYAKDLIEFIKEFDSNFYVTVACYPETHLEAKSAQADILYLKEKVQAGADHLVSQLFFENEKFLTFLEKLNKAGICCPVQAGIMPITNAKQVQKMAQLSGAAFPKEVLDYANKFEDQPQEMYKFGIEFASKQIENLLEQKINGIHLYSMNNYETVKDIYDRTKNSFNR